MIVYYVVCYMMLYKDKPADAVDAAEANKDPIIVILYCIIVV